MTVSSTVTPRQEHNGNGSTVDFPVTFPYAAETDVKVIHVDSSGVETTWVDQTHYSISGSSVVAVAAPADGEKLVIYRETSKTQTLDLKNNRRVPGSVEEAALDKVTYIMQELLEAVSRCVQNSMVDGEVTLTGDDISSVATNAASAAASAFAASLSETNAIAAEASALAAAAVAEAAITRGSVTVNTFVAGTDYTAGSTTQLTLSVEPLDNDSLLVFFDGTLQETTEWSITDSIITFDSAIGAGVTSVEVIIFPTIASVDTPFKKVSVLATDIASAGTDDTHLVVVDEQALSANLTIPSNVTLHIIKPGQVTGAYTLTVDGRIIADRYQIFGSSLTVSFGSDLTDEFYPEWWGAAADGSTNDRDHIASALNARGVATLSAGDYHLSTNLNVGAGYNLNFKPGAKLSVASGVVFGLVGGAFKDAPPEHIVDTADDTCDIRLVTGPRAIKPEWFNFKQENSAAVNGAAWERMVKVLYQNDPDRAVFKMEFLAGKYNTDSVLYLPKRMELHGAGMWSTEINISGTDHHGVETCLSSGGTILTDGDMTSSPSYCKMFDLEIDCADIVQSAGRFAMFYGAGLSSGVIQRCRFNGPRTAGTYTSLMDGVLIIPTYEITGSHKGAIRNLIKENRISNFRDGIMIGRFSNTLDAWEPASGGTDGSIEPGEAYENRVYWNYLVGAADDPVLTPRYGISVQRDTNTSARNKPYSVNVKDNSIDAGVPGNLTGTVSKTNGNNTVTGVGTSFTTEINLDDTTVAMVFSDETLRITSVDSDTQLTMTDTPSSNKSGETVTIRKGDKRVARKAAE